MILDEIAAKTRKRVAAAKEQIAPQDMRRRAEEAAGNYANSHNITGGDLICDHDNSSPAAVRVDVTRIHIKSPFGTTSPFEAALTAPGLSFICEVKRASPSKGIIAGGEDFPYLDIARTYEDAGASAISVLTEPDFFLGDNRYLEEIAQRVKIPVLRKDFILDPYQIYEAAALGARAVLLIAALLDRKTLSAFLALAAELGLAALTEVHSERELETVLVADPPARIIGINNRNLQTFEVDLAVTGRLRPLIPEGRIVVAESGVRTAEDVKRLAAYGVDALLVGESFMRAADKKALLTALKAAAAEHSRPGKGVIMRAHTPDKEIVTGPKSSQELPRKAPSWVRTRVRIKICGLFREADIDYVNEAMPDYIGFVFAEKSRRYVTPGKAVALRKRLREGIVPVGVFVRAKPEEAAALYRDGVISVLQLHGEEDDAYIEKLKNCCADPVEAAPPIIRAISADRLGTLNTLDETFNGAGGPAVKSGGADYFLIDNGKGGTGESFDWSLLKSFPPAAFPVPVFLAGGIGLHNIGEALRYRPYAVDVSSGAETGGVKDREKVVSLAEYVRLHGADNNGE